MSVRIKFPNEPDSFYKDVCKEVNEYFKLNKLHKYGNTSLVIKYLILKTIFITTYVFIYYFQNSFLLYVAFIFLGPLCIILAINISHDAIHEIAHSNKWINTYFAIQMDLIGANSYVWKKRHQIGHHVFPNTLEKDPDLTQSVIVKILPNSIHKSYHKYQHIYVPFLYSIYTINWIYIRDFKDFFSKKSFLKKIPTTEYMKFIMFKTFYISLFILTPIYYTSLSIFQVFIGNILLHVTASYFLTLALVPSHVSENSVFVKPAVNGKMPYSWSHHQIMTTTDFATNSTLTTWLLGGFNHHVTHHLFPNISHVHYPKLTPIIKRLAINYGLKYNHESSLFEAYKSHYYLLKNNGNNNLQLPKNIQLYYKQLITERFIDNPRMSLLFNNEKKKFKKNVFNLVNYCFTIALKLDGVFIARNKKTIVLFYEKNKFRKTLRDHFNYLKVVKGIPLSNILKVLKNEKKVKKHQLKLDNFIYVWFIAQQKGYSRLDGLNEINKMLIKTSKISKLPILFETSDNKLLNLYNHAGFKVYKELNNGGETIYFLSNMNSIK